jgi:predicted Zn-dependent protease
MYEDEDMREHVVQMMGTGQTDPGESRLLTNDGIARIVEQVAAAVTDASQNTTVQVAGWWNSELSVSRNRIALSSHRRDLRVSVTRVIKGASGTASTNQLDATSLKGVTHAAERIALFLSGLNRSEVAPLPTPELASPGTHIWSEVTSTLPAEQQTAVAVQLAKDAEANGMLAAGYIETRLGELATHRLGPVRTMTYQRFTQAQCSMTVRHPNGAGSGWAGLSSYDWSALHPKQLVQLSLDKCLKSLNPVAIEPGRYTVILEPQAVADLCDTLVWAFRVRSDAEGRQGHPFFLSPEPAFNTGRSKLGLKIVDERITMSHLPTDPVLGVIPEPGMRPITWIDRGVLTSISHDRDNYSLPRVNENFGDLWRPSYRINGGNSSVEQMIAQTERGLLVTRFSTVTALDPKSVLATGLTRDGLWLIERGKISRAVRNMRFTESMLFALNQLDSLGESVPVFRPVDSPYSPGLTPAVVPPMKVRDFSFTSMVDAV